MIGFCCLSCIYIFCGMHVIGVAVPSYVCFKHRLHEHIISLVQIDKKKMQKLGESDDIPPKVITN